MTKTLRNYENPSEWKRSRAFSEGLESRLGSHHTGIIEEHLLGWLPAAECAQTGQLLLCFLPHPPPTSDFSDKIRTKINIMGKGSYKKEACAVGKYLTLNHSNILLFILFLLNTPWKSLEKLCKFLGWHIKCLFHHSLNSCKESNFQNIINTNITVLNVANGIYRYHQFDTIIYFINK